MRVRAAHETGVQGAGEPDVVDETAAPAEQGRVLEARDAGAEMLRAHDRVSRNSATRRGTIHRSRCIAIARSRTLAPTQAGRFSIMLDVSTDARRSAGSPAGPPLDFQAHLAALEARGLLTRVERAINKDTELHPLVRWQFQGGLAESARRAF